MKVEFKVFYNNKPASKKKLEEIEEIVVEQEVNKVWEARIKILDGPSEKGIWEGEKDTTRREFTRVRIEIRVGTGDFQPLIDGKIVDPNVGRGAIPGESTTTLVIHDDSVRLHSQDELQRYDSGSDSEIARAILNAADLGGKIDVDDTPVSPVNPAAEIIQNGTKMRILRSLAAKYGNFYAYVLPGKDPGKSIGCFKKLPQPSENSLPTLYMFGEKRNLAEFNTRQNSRSPSRVVAATIGLRDKKIITSVSSYLDSALRGDTAATDLGQARVELTTDSSNENENVRRLPPGQSNAVDLDGATAGEAERSSFSLEAEGSVLPLCYRGVLSPYRVVPVRLSDSQYSTNYVIFKVVHTLTRSVYTQSFRMKANAVSSASGTSGTPRGVV